MMYRMFRSAPGDRQWATGRGVGGAKGGDRGEWGTAKARAGLMTRLIQKWLKADILEDGIVTINERGTGQGSVVSPLLANVYLHYVFDLWAERWRQREASGDMIIVRYADDIIGLRQRLEL